MAVDLTLGALEIGIALATCLHGVITVQAYSYACSEYKDGLFLQLFILCVWIIETLHTVFHWVYLYLTTVTHFGQLAPLGTIPWYFGIPGALGTLSSLTQAYFAYRVKVVSGKWFVAIVAWTGALVRLVLGFTFAAIGIRTHSFVQFYDQYRWLIIGPIIVDLMVDIWNTGSLCYYLAPQRPDKQLDLKNTRKVVNRIMLWAVETGLVTWYTFPIYLTYGVIKKFTAWAFEASPSLCTVTAAMLTLIFALAFPKTFLWVAILTFYSKLYAISLLVSLNGRKTLRENHNESLSYRSVLWIEGSVSAEPPISVTRTIHVETMAPLHSGGTKSSPGTVNVTDDQEYFIANDK